MVEARLAPVRDLLIGEDPGALRLREAGRGALATLSAGLLAILVLPPQAGAATTGAVVVTLLIVLLCSLVIQDPRPADRRRYLLVAILPITAALAVASVLPRILILQVAFMLALLFAAFAARRYGRGASELGLLAAFAFYLAASRGVPVGQLPWFVLAAFIGVLVTYLWQAFILPYDPARSLGRAIAAFGGQAAATVEAVIRGIEGGEPGARAVARMRRRLERVRNCRAVIEAQISFVAPPGQVSRRLRDLEIDLLNAEQGLGLMVVGATVLAGRIGDVPAAVREALTRALAALRASLTSSEPRIGVADLRSLSDDLRESARQALASGTTDAWAFHLLRIGTGGYQLAQAVRQVRAIDRLDASVTDDDAGPTRAAQAPVSSGAASSRQGGGSPRRRHPTTILGLQAVLASGLAMLAVYFLGLTNPQWAIFTAFLVIGGSTAESLRRIVLRLGGVVGGTLFGSLLSVLPPNNSFFVVGVVAVCHFMVLFWAPVSYDRMVFWMTTATVMLLTASGGAEVVDILVALPLVSLLGGLCAALVVESVLPIRIGPRFNAYLGAFLEALDRQIGDCLGVLLGRASPAELDRSELKVSDAFSQLQQTFAAAAFEYNPFNRAQSPQARQTTILRALNESAQRLTRRISDSDLVGRPGDEAANVATAFRERIHENVEALRAFLAGDRAAVVHWTADVQPGSAPSPELADAFERADDARETTVRRITDELSRVEVNIVQLAAGLGTKVESVTTAPSTSPHS